MQHYSMLRRMLRQSPLSPSKARKSKIEMSDSSVEGFDGLQPPAVVLTPQEVLRAGLVLVNYTLARMHRAQVAKTNLK